MYTVDLVGAVAAHGTPTKVTVFELHHHHSRHADTNLTNKKKEPMQLLLKLINEPSASIVPDESLNLPNFRRKCTRFQMKCKPAVWQKKRCTGPTNTVQLYTKMTTDKIECEFFTCYSLACQIPSIRSPATFIFWTPIDASACVSYADIGSDTIDHHKFDYMKLPL